VDRGLDPLTTNLVVADETRSDGTICLAVSPSMKAYGIPGRARLFEVKQRVQAIKESTGKEIQYIIAPPRMQRYLDVSADIYGVYLKYVAPESCHVYSIDEIFIDVAEYLSLYEMTAHELAIAIVRDVLATTGITATAGIGTNLYLAKIAMDIEAKHVPADKDGVRIAELDEMSFREKLWGHKPLTDFWMIAEGTTKRLEKFGVHTMGDLAKLSLTHEDLLFHEFGVDAEILVDHAWGHEPCRMEHIKNYKSDTKSFSSGQALKCGYDYDKTKIVIKEMTEEVIRRLIATDMVAEGIHLHISYDWKSTADGTYSGPTQVNYYGRKAPVSARGTTKLGGPTACPSRIMKATLELFEKIIDPKLSSRKLYVTAIRLSNREDVPPQLGFFVDTSAEDREIALVKAMLRVQDRFGKSAVFKCYDLLDGATTLERNEQIGGHKANG
jgi:DNA polymerase V